MEKLKVIELFGGIGACTQALKRIGIDFEVVDYVDIDKYAVKSYNAINDTNYEPQDIAKWDKDIKADLIFHGSPCQDFSLAGKQAGGDEGSGTRSSLMYETLRIVEKIRPKYVVWENVKNIISQKHRHNYDNYLTRMEEMGYKNFYKVLNAKDFNVPQNRERVFTISIQDGQEFEFPKPVELKIKLKDLLEDEVDEKYYLSDKAIQGRLTTQYNKYKLEGHVVNDKEVHPTILARYDGAPTLYIKNNTKQGYLEATDGDGCYISNIDKKRGTVQKEMIPTIKTSLDVGVVVKAQEDFVSKKYKEFEENNGYIPDKFNPYNCKEIKDIAPTQTTQCGSTGTSSTVLMKNELRIRKLTPKECWRLMDFDDECYEKASKVNSSTQLYKQAGNSIVVGVLEAIFRELFKEE